MAVLGLSFNSTIIGSALFQDGSLIEYDLTVFKESWSFLKLSRIVESIITRINDNNIISVALTIPYAHHESEKIKTIIDQIKAHCRKGKIYLFSFHPKTFHAFCPEGKPTKESFMKSLATRYPELRSYCKKELGNQQPYYHKLFEAVAAATLHIRDIEARRQ